jgi:F-type H+-transporting ATPase subunit epsilon
MPVALEIVSPEKLLLSRSVDMVVIPASEGDMGVLGGHSPMIVTLRGGTISLYEGDTVTDRLFVAGGFAEVTPERCTVLATEVLPVAEVRKDEGERRLAEAHATFAALHAGDVEEQLLVLEQMDSARALVQLAESLLTGSR